MRFYLDEDQSYRVARRARELGADVTSASEQGRMGLEDRDQLLFAAEEGRAIVTRNQRHFAPLTLEFQRRAMPHAGVLFLPPSLPNEAFEAIAQAIAAYDREHPDGMPPYMVDYLRPVRP